MNKKENNNREKKNNIKRKKTKKKHRILKAFIILIFLIMIFIGAFIGYSTFKNGWGVKGIIQTAMGQDEKKLENLDPFTVLLMGVSEDISTKLTDTIIVASYNPKTQKATLISIPRDTFVGTNKNKATSGDKINALYQTSPQKTLAAVNKITGLNIQYYVVISNNALVQVVDTIGGVDFDVPINMDYDDSSQDLYIHLKAGPQKLNGEQAEWLVRFRKNNNGTSYPSSYGDNDLGRMKTQREFLKAVTEQTLRVKNITKIGNLIDIIKENVSTNITNWSIIKDYIPYVVDFNTENLQTANIPGTPSSFGPYKLSFFVYSEKETKSLIDQLFTEQNGAVEPETPNENLSEDKTNTTNNEIKTNETSNNSNIKIELLNGSGDGTLLTKATKALKEQGFNVYKTGTTTITSKTTIVNKKAVKEEVTTNIKNLLGVGNVSSSTSTSSSVDVTVVIGKDYK